MTHTSTELKQMLALADACAGDWEAVRSHLVVQALRDLVARVQELEEEIVDQCRIIGMSGERELHLLARIDDLEVSQAKCVQVVPNELREAAQAVIDRWDSPLWKDLPATGDYIARLRKALAASPSHQR